MNPHFCTAHSQQPNNRKKDSTNHWSQSSSCCHKLYLPRWVEEYPRQLHNAILERWSPATILKQLDFQHWTAHCQAASKKKIHVRFNRLVTSNSADMQNATFDGDRRSELKAPKSTRLGGIVSLDASSHSSSVRSCSPDHLMERYTSILGNARLKSKMDAPQMPQRKVPMSVMPLSIPIRKVSTHNIAKLSASTPRRWWSYRERPHLLHKLAITAVQCQGQPQSCCKLL